MFKKDVLAHFGGNGTAVARAVGVTRSAVSQWKEVIPEAIAYRIQDVTCGALRVDPSLYRGNPMPSPAVSYAVKA